MQGCNSFYCQTCNIASYQLNSLRHTHTHTDAVMHAHAHQARTHTLSGIQGLWKPLISVIHWGVVGVWDGPLTVADGGIHCRLCHSYLTALSGSLSSITVTSVWHAKYMMSATAQEICPLNEDGQSLCVCEGGWVCCVCPCAVYLSRCLQQVEVCMKTFGSYIYWLCSSPYIDCCSGEINWLWHTSNSILGRT